MWPTAHVFWDSKAGNTSDEYEDAYWAEHLKDDENELFICAIADGATSTSYSKLWAQLLVQAYCNRTFDPHQAQNSLTPVQQEWRNQIGSKPLPWFAQEKLRQGAFATILGITLQSDDSHEAGCWQAVAIGDSCLVQIRQGQLLCSFPLAQSFQFDSSPVLLSSNPSSNQQIQESLCTVEGTWQTGDSFLLMTDALACWFISSMEQQHTDHLDRAFSCRH